MHDRFGRMADTWSIRSALPRARISAELMRE